METRQSEQGSEQGKEDPCPGETYLLERGRQAYRRASQYLRLCSQIPTLCLACNQCEKVYLNIFWISERTCYLKMCEEWAAFARWIKSFLFFFSRILLGSTVVFTPICWVLKDPLRLPFCSPCPIGISERAVQPPWPGYFQWHKWCRGWHGNDKEPSKCHSRHCSMLLGFSHSRSGLPTECSQPI